MMMIQKMSRPRKLLGPPGTMELSRGDDL